MTALCALISRIAGSSYLRCTADQIYTSWTLCLLGDHCGTLNPDFVGIEKFDQENTRERRIKSTKSESPEYSGPSRVSGYIPLFSFSFFC